MRKKFDRGEPITNWTAEDYRDIVRRIEAADKMTGAAPVRVKREKSARIMSIDHTQGFYATLSGSASPYSFTEKYGSTGGAWSTGVRTGTSNAYEVNGTASLNGKTVWLEPGYPGDYRFQYVNSAGGGGGGGTGSFGGCYCTTAPATIYLHVSVEGGDFGAFNSATMQYTTPPCTGGPYGAMAYFSSTSFVDPIFGDSFYYYIRCTGASFYLGVVYPSSVFGSCYNYDIYLWDVSDSPSTCSPIYWTGGTNLVSGTTTAEMTESP